MSARSGAAWRVMEKATELARAGVDFALATVVWRQAPSSGHQGARAIITADGELHGWIGGACAEPVVVGEALRAIADRRPRLILLGAADQFGEVPDGMMVVPMSCQSEGAMELYIEPVVPSPRLLVVGRSPMASTLVELATVLGWQAELVDAGSLADTAIDRRAVVVVATQGHGDEDALERAVTARPAFVGLVASRTRGEAVLGYLADRGVPGELLDRVKVPVGLDLGHTSHPEIAVAVLAELVELRARGALDPRRGVDETLSAESDTAPGTAVDPVCGMTVPADDTGRPFEHGDSTYYFCCPGCRAAFSRAPASFIGEEAAC
jgi:xanthine dehydrogenase accessory factor